MFGRKINLHEELVFENVLPFLDLPTIGNLTTAYKNIYKYCHKKNFNSFWQNIIAKHNLYPSIRPYPTNTQNYFTIFLRLCESNTCFECLQKNVYNIHPFYRIYICNFCQKTSQIFSCLAYGNAKTYLNDDDLNKLPSYTYISQFPYRAQRVFLHSDVIQMYNNHPITFKRSARLEELQNALSVIGITVRYDSELCQDYIEGRTTVELGDLVEKLAFMKYLHEYTDYKEQLETEVQHLRLQFGCFYPGIWKEAGEFVKLQYVIPDVWPWLQTL